MIHPLVHGRGARSWQRGCSSRLSLGNMSMCKFSDTHEDSVPSCLPRSFLDLTQDWISLSGLSRFVAGCHHLEKTMCTLMAVTPIAPGLLISRDGTRYSRARPASTDLPTLKRGAGTLHTPWMIPRTPGLASDLRVTHLDLPVGGWTIEMCRMKSLSVVHPVLPGFHRQGILAPPPRARPHPRLRPPFAPLESGQNLRHTLASVLDRLCGPLLTLAPTLRNLLCDRRFSEVTLSVNSVVGVAVVCDLECAFRRMAFVTPSLPPLCHP